MHGEEDLCKVFGEGFRMNITYELPVEGKLNILDISWDISMNLDQRRAFPFLFGTFEVDKKGHRLDMPRCRPGQVLPPFNETKLQGTRG